MESYRLFLDTNVILDMLLQRDEGEHTKTIISVSCKENCIVSLSSFYTITFYAEIYLKKNGILGEPKMTKLRSIMNDLLDILSVYGVDEEALRSGINDMDFTDLEDSYQLQTAIAAGCDMIITNNIKDFKKCTKLPVLTPEAFVRKYIKDPNKEPME